MIFNGFRHFSLQMAGIVVSYAPLDVRLRSLVFNFKQSSNAFSAYMASSIASLSPS
jgi:hypothetical protein